MDTRCLILDPLIPSTRDRLGKFQALAESEHAWLFERIPLFTADTDGQAWVNQAFEKLDRANVIVCFGSWLAAVQLGSDVDRFLRAIGDRARAGVPILIEAPRLGEQLQHSSTTVPRGIPLLLKQFEVVNRPGNGPPDRR